MARVEFVLQRLKFNYEKKLPARKADSLHEGNPQNNEMVP
jgi:hypothetical protein